MAQSFDYLIEKAHQGVRLDHFLALMLPDLTRSQLKRLIEQKHVTADGKPTKPGQKLKPGHNISVNIPDPVQTELEPDANVVFEIIYQDKSLVVVNKPAGLVVHPAVGHQTGTLVHGLLAACPDIVGIGGEVRPGIVHRLDKDTTGVMVAAKTHQAHLDLIDQFKTGHIKKEYLAICRGWPQKDKGRIESPIGRHPTRRKEMSIHSRAGRPSLTLFRVERRFGQGLSLIRLDLKSGRTHQIRVHLSSIGCPIIGDAVYGVGLSWLGRGAVALKGIVHRQLLHAEKLRFRHPETGEEMSFSAPLPDDFLKLIDKLSIGETE